MAPNPPNIATIKSGVVSANVPNKAIEGAVVNIEVKNMPARIIPKNFQSSREKIIFSAVPVFTIKIAKATLRAKRIISCNKCFFLFVTNKILTG